MPGGSDGLWAVRVQVALGQGRIAWPGFVGAGDLPAAPDHLCVLFAGATFGSGEVIPALMLEQVRAFDMLWLACRVRTAIDQYRAWADHLLRGDVELLHPDGTMSVVKHRALRNVVVDHPSRAVVVEEQRRINAGEAQPDRVRPWPGRILRGDDEISAIAVEAGVGDVEGALVVADGGCEQPAGQFILAVLDLPGAIDGIADLPPRDHVTAVENRQAGEIAEGRIHQIEIIAHPDR